MKWSISKSAIFSQCPRKWYYSEIMANRSLKDSKRREVYLLKQLQSVYAWRGTLVDKVISDFIVPKINYRIFPVEDEVISYAMNIMDEQLEFAGAKKYLNDGSNKSNSGNSYCALFEVEYKGGVDNNVIEDLREEVKTSLRNFLKSDLLKSLISQRAYVVAQRSLAFPYDDITVRCTPDVIALFSNRNPLIIDWKVHSQGVKEYWLQLGMYAFALSRKPHKDFLKYRITSNAKDVSLTEYQLLNDQQRNYSLSDEDIIEIEDYIYKSVTSIKRIVNGGNYDTLDINQLPTAHSPFTCMNCQFRKICWKTLEVQNGAH